MNLFGALEAHANSRAMQVDQITEYMRHRIVALSNSINTVIAAEKLNTEARTGSMREQMELLIENERSNYASREATLLSMRGDVEQALNALENDLTELRNALLAGEFKPPVKYQQPEKEDTRDADALGLLPRSLSGGEQELSVNET